MTVALFFKRPFVLIPAFFLLAGLILGSHAKALADGIKTGKIIRSRIRQFPRSIRKGDGHGGFAYNGIRKALQIEDHALAAIDKTPPPSTWLEKEKKLYSDLLKSGKYDLFIVPFQTQLDGVDAIGRALMADRLALEIERRTDLRVAPMPLVHLALGSTARVIDDDQVYAFFKVDRQPA